MTDTELPLFKRSPCPKAKASRWFISGIIILAFVTSRRVLPNGDYLVKMNLWEIINETRQKLKIVETTHLGRTKNLISEITEKFVSLFLQEKINKPYEDLILNEDSENTSRVTVVQEIGNTAHQVGKSIDSNIIEEIFESSNMSKAPSELQQTKTDNGLLKINADRDSSSSKTVSGFGNENIDYTQKQIMSPNRINHDEINNIIDAFQKSSTKGGDETSHNDAKTISQKLEEDESSPQLLEVDQSSQPKLKITLRNELPNDVQLYWEASENGIVFGSRYEQGLLYSHGGEMNIETSPGHIFSYVHEKVRYYITAPNQSNDSYIVLNANEEDIVVRCTSSVRGMAYRGQVFTIVVKPDWAPRGAARFLELVRNKYYDMVAVRDVGLGGFARFGIARDPVLRAQWSDSYIPDDLTLSQIPFEPGMISFAGKSEPNTRSTDAFIVMPNISRENLDRLGRKNPWETPFGFVKDVNLTAVSEWFVYEDNNGPDFEMINKNGNQYVSEYFPRTDFIERCVVVRDVVQDEL